MTPAKRKKAACGGRSLIEALEPIEAKRLLGSLLDTRPDLVPEVAALADAKLGEVSVESVAEEVAWAIGELRVEDIWDGSGSQSDGSYVEPTEAAYAVVDDALTPLIQDIKRRMQLGREDEAAGVCQGILLGLYQVTVQCRDQGHEFLDGYAPDAIEEAAGFVLETWKKAGGRADPQSAVAAAASPRARATGTDSSQAGDHSGAGQQAPQNRGRTLSLGNDLLRTLSILAQHAEHICDRPFLNSFSLRQSPAPGSGSAPTRPPTTSPPEQCLRTHASGPTL